ncbi:MAG: 1-(5-phosphoribosyl)-5-[(5-phosphoribosylamino)methylideneamino]imidazole-4-carboxamide isomerase [bacterium]|nr:1-(5-phosphoribosyl)-5-[(5-phosphoribosylamino)methylideneamino]imidazole-4-carboxamide isomerase [bacterium]
MLVIPAIDLMDGKCVRLLRGETESKVVYSDDPVGVAKKWESLGAEYLHLVDLDGAVSGKIANLRYVQDIFQAVSIPAQFGGGVRGMDQISAVLQAGVERVVLGTRACEKSFLADALSWFDDRIAVGIDARNGIVAVEGWTRQTDLRAVDFARQVEQMGVKTIIFTDILVDGTLQGPNLTSIEALTKAVRVNIIASGGVRSLDDIRELRAFEEDGVTGVIVGKALYEGTIDLSQAIRLGKGQ